MMANDEQILEHPHSEGTSADTASGAFEDFLTELRDRHTPSFGTGRFWLIAFVGCITSTVGFAIALFFLRGHIHTGWTLVPVWGVVLSASLAPMIVLLEIFIGVMREVRFQIRNLVSAAATETRLDLVLIARLRRMPKEEVAYMKCAYLRNYLNYQVQYSFITLPGVFGILSLSGLRKYLFIEDIFPQLRSFLLVPISGLFAFVCLALISTLMKVGLKLKGGQHQRVLDILDWSLQPPFSPPAPRDHVRMPPSSARGGLPEGDASFEP